MCHVSLPSGGVYAEESVGVVEDYRCVVCHASLSRTVNHFRSIAQSPHSSLGCLFCHVVYHSGHQSYGSTTGRVYGCFGGRCHQIVTQDYSFPSGATVYFLNTYTVKTTASSGFDIIRYLLFYPKDPSGAGRGTYAMLYANPYKGFRVLYDSTKRYWVCLHCHFVRVGVNETGVYETYWLRHPDKCYDCHSADVSLTGHSVIKAARSWDFCSRCHIGIGESIKGTVHAGIGCRCHSIAHISRYNSSMTWLRVYYPPPGTYITPPYVDFTIWARRLVYDWLNGSALGIPVHGLQVDTDVRYATVAYVLRDANATRTPELKWLTCYNCHIVVTGGGGASTLQVLDGRIPIPPLTLLNIRDPHTIGRVNNTQFKVEDSEKGVRVEVVLAIAMVITATWITWRIIKTKLKTQQTPSNKPPEALTLP